MKTKREESPKKSSSKTEQDIGKISADVESLQAQMNTANIALKKHDDDLSEHKRLISQHSNGLEKLEQKVGAAQIIPSVPETIPTFRPIELPTPSTTPVPATTDSTQKFDINHFSEQQKRILAIFFQNQGMALAYTDIAKILEKSPHTIKNQMREIRLKADLFERSIGEQSRHRFKLKKDLRVEKYLNVG
ncbi:helix-turn-helix transcriptional regulator [Planctomycetota bacterium]